MYEIPKPELLDPDRVDRDDREDLTAEDHRSRSQLLAKALGESCAYADQLWEQVNALRGYLLDSLPPGPRIPGPHTTAAASPTGPEDEEGWLNWINAFATTTSVLCGSHGDSGFGLSRAREEARLRRSAPELSLHAAHPDLGRSGAEPAGNENTAAGRTAGSTTESPANGLPATESSTTNAEATRRSSAFLGKAAARAVVAVLAVRGLRTLLPARRRVSRDI